MRGSISRLQTDYGQYLTQQVDFTDIHGASLLRGSEGRRKEARWKVRQRMKRTSGYWPSYCMMYLFPADCTASCSSRQHVRDALVLVSTVLLGAWDNRSAREYGSARESRIDQKTENWSEIARVAKTSYHCRRFAA